MATCTECSAALEPQWRFCVRCGAMVDRVDPAATPSAIRPEPDAEPLAVAPLSLFLWGLGALLALIAIVAISVAVFVRS